MTEQQLVVQRFKNQTDTDSILRDQGAFREIDQVIARLNKFTEVING